MVNLIDDYDVEQILGDIEDAPAINFVKHGKWIKMSDADGDYWCCPECGEDIPRILCYDPQFDLFPRLKSIDRTNFCPNCGARLGGKKE